MPRLSPCTALFLCLFVFFVAIAPAADPCVSGPQTGQRPGPYTFVVSTGPNRGQLHCYICETADKPAVIIFARHLNDPLGKLLRGVDKSLADHKAADLRCWVTFLHDDQSSIDAKIIDWGKKHAVRNVPLGVFEDVGGPPSYRLHRDAEVTVLLSVKQKVVANFAFRANELTDEKIAEVLKAVPQIVSGK